MSSILVDNNNLATPVLKPGAAVVYNQDGTLVGRAVFGIQKGVIDAQAPNIGDPHPKDSDAKLSSFAKIYNESEGEYQCEYGGLWANTVQRVQGLANTSQDPIVTHPAFVSTLGGTSGGPLNLAIFADDGEFVAWPPNAPNNLGGIQSWLTGGLTIVIQYATDSSATFQAAIAKIGTTTSTLVAGKTTFTAAFPQFLCTSVTYDEISTGASTAYWIIQEQWTRTESPGWNSLVY